MRERERVSERVSEREREREREREVVRMERGTITESHKEEDRQARDRDFSISLSDLTSSGEKRDSCGEKKEI